MKERKEQYRQRVLDFTSQAAAHKVRYERFAYARLAIFVAAVGLCIYLWSLHFTIGLAFVFAFIAAFYRFVKWHQKMKDKQRHCEALAAINEREAAALDHNYSDFHPGTEFMDSNHPYSLDLDLFGEYSFFQFCNRTSTLPGRQRLADYLKQPASLKVIRQRQEAIAELKDQIDWRQHFMVRGMEAEDREEHLRLLKKWLDEPPFVSHRRWLIAAMYLMPLWTVAALGFWAFYLPWQLAIFFFLPAVLLIRNTFKKVNETHLHTTHAENILKQYAKLIAHIEGKEFFSEKLKHHHDAFHAEDQVASQAINRLSYIIAQLNVRYNIFAVLLNIGGLWDLHWVYRLEKWKAATGNFLAEWFEAMQEFEAIASLANLYYNNPDWVFPEVHQKYELQAIAIGHPLIPPAKRVNNDINIPTQGHIKLITGSNMAGKSTFLRTLGLNIVLAMAGAPVCAEALKLPTLRVYTSMRTQDALHESTSSFYAELKRLKFIIEAVEKGENIFFLLDEILKGTNSRDRHTGSKALIRQLIKSKGSGLIATHDLELGQLEATAGGAVENLCLEVAIRDDRLFFDYKLKKGVSQSFNATLLMKNMGIRIEE